MTATTQSAGRLFYDEQVRYCETKDIEGIRAHYAEDAVLVSFDHQIFGRDAIADYFVGYLDGMPGLKLVSTDKFVETPDSIFFEATISLDAGVARVFDAFTFRDGKAHRHFTGLLSFTPKG